MTDCKQASFLHRNHFIISNKASMNIIAQNENSDHSIRQITSIHRLQSKHLKKTLPVQNWSLSCIKIKINSYYNPLHRICDGFFEDVGFSCSSHAALLTSRRPGPHVEINSTIFLTCFVLRIMNVSHFCVSWHYVLGQCAIIHFLISRKSQIVLF